MNANALRTGGIMAGAALLVGALGLAITGGDPAPSDKTEPAEVVRPAAETIEPARPAEKQAPVEEPVFETAVAVAGSVSFIVRFAPDHPLARAQNLAAEGRMADAEREAERVVRRRRDLRGLCFDRFTVGGAEIVLRACDGVPAGEQEAFQRLWSERLQAMSGVEYAEANVILQPERR